MASDTFGHAAKHVMLFSSSQAAQQSQRVSKMANVTIEFFTPYVLATDKSQEAFALFMIGCALSYSPPYNGQTWTLADAHCLAMRFTAEWDSAIFDDTLH